MGKLCLVCDKEAVVTCDNCADTLYCNDDHKKESLAKHKPECRPVRIKTNTKYGRYLVTSRSVKAGEQLLRERPIVVGPRVDSLPACIECLTLLYPSMSRCSRCGVSPLCSRCNHSPLECQLYTSLNEEQKGICLKASNQYIMPLKIMLHLKSTNGDEIFKKILEMESHMESRRGTFVWLSYEKDVVQLLRTCGVISESKEDAELVQHICGVLDVNSFEVRGAMGLSGMGMRLRGVYPEASLLAHDCVGNVHLSVDNNFVMTIRASVDIAEGQPVLYNYTDPLKPTHERQNHLREGKYFSCNCSRCEDLTELGTFLGALICPRCKDGYVLSSVSSEGWKCQKCEHIFSSGLMEGANVLARNLLDTIDRSEPQQLEEVLKTLGATFGPTHSIIIDVKQSIVAALRELEPDKQSLLRKIELCRELLPIVGVLEPGISRLRGITLYELHIGLVSLAQECGKDAEDMKNVGAWLREAEEVLKEAVGLLLYEPSASPEGELARQAMAELKSLKMIITKHDTKEKKKKKLKHKK